jgi:hypothetical protein
MKTARQAALLLAVLAAGCTASTPEELERLVKEDPAFSQMITARDQMHREIRLIKQDLLERKKTADTQASKIRNDYDAFAKAGSVKISKYQETIAASRNVLQREIETKSAQLAAKETETAGYDKTLADVKKVLRESKGLTISAAEKEKWEERMLMLSEKMKPLSDEIQDLKAEIALKKRKIGFLK